MSKIEEATADVAKTKFEEMTTDGGYGLKPVAFNKVDGFTTFRGEYALDGEDVVLHFWKTKEVKNHPFNGKYWTRIFPKVLSDTAEEHFQATYPRLRAAFSEELDSWWMRALGYGHVLDLDAYVRAFLTKLDQKLDMALFTEPPTAGEK